MLGERGERAYIIRHAICKILATEHKPLSVNDILSKLHKEYNIIISPRTLRYHLDFLIKIGRVHIKKIGGVTYYEWNGFHKYQERIYISDNHVLFLDVLINKQGKIYIRIKERKQGEDLGAIIIPLELIDELINKLKRLKENADYLEQELIREKVDNLIKELYKEDVEGFLKEELEQ